MPRNTLPCRLHTAATQLPASRLNRLAEQKISLRHEKIDRLAQRLCTVRALARGPARLAGHSVACSPTCPAGTSP